MKAGRLHGVQIRHEVLPIFRLCAQCSCRLTHIRLPKRNRETLQKLRCLSDCLFGLMGSKSIADLGVSPNVRRDGRLPTLQNSPHNVSGGTLQRPDFHDGSGAANGTTSTWSSSVFPASIISRRASSHGRSTHGWGVFNPPVAANPAAGHHCTRLPSIIRTVRDLPSFLLVSAAD